MNADNIRKFLLRESRIYEFAARACFSVGISLIGWAFVQGLLGIDILQPPDTQFWAGAIFAIVGTHALRAFDFDVCCQCREKDSSTLI